VPIIKGQNEENIQICKEDFIEKTDNQIVSIKC